MSQPKFYIRTVHRIDNIEVIPDLKVSLKFNFAESGLVQMLASKMMYPNITEETYRNPKTIHKETDIYIEVSCSIIPTTRIIGALQEIIDNGVYPYKKTPNSHIGAIWPLNSYENFFQEFIKVEQPKLLGVNSQIFDLLRWQHPYLNQKNSRLIGMTNISVSQDRQNWKPLPTLGEFSLSFVENEQVDNDFFNLQRINELLNQKISEPYYQQILREAKSLTDSSLEASAKSSVIFSVLAIEVAIKELIARLSPQSTWLIDNLNSPPIEKLLIEYIPILLNEECGHHQELIDRLKKVIFTRNSIVHQRDIVIRKATSNSAYILASDIIKWVETTLERKGMLYI